MERVSRRKFLEVSAKTAFGLGIADVGLASCSPDASQESSADAEASPIVTPEKPILLTVEQIVNQLNSNSLKAGTAVQIIPPKISDGTLLGIKNLGKKNNSVLPQYRVTFTDTTQIGPGTTQTKDVYLGQIVEGNIQTGKEIHSIPFFINPDLHTKVLSDRNRPAIPVVDIIQNMDFKVAHVISASSLDKQNLDSTTNERNVLEVTEYTSPNP